MGTTPPKEDYFDEIEEGIGVGNATDVKLYPFLK